MSNEASSAGAAPVEPPAGGWLSLALRAAAYGGIWWLVSRGSAASWIVGVPAIALALLAVRWLSPTSPPGRNLAALIRFVPYFLWESLRGGINAAILVCRLRYPLRPVIRDYHTALPDGLPRALFVSVIGLLPGTLVAEVHGDRLVIHVLDATFDIHEDIVRLERNVAAVFAVDLPGRPEPVHD